MISTPRAVRFANLFTYVSYWEQLKGSENLQTHFAYRKRKHLQSLTLANEREFSWIWKEIFNTAFGSHHTVVKS